MRLISVTFRSPIAYRGGATGQLVSSRCSSLEVDRTTRVVRINGGADGEVPLENVLLYVPEQERETCPECGGEFADARALAGHRAGKHGVRGVRSRNAVESGATPEKEEKQ